MLTLSKNFKLDIVGTDQLIKLYIIILKTDGNIKHLFSTDKENIINRLSDGSDVNITPLSLLSKVSTVRISTDYDSKTLKINRLRCTFFN